MPEQSCENQTKVARKSRESWLEQFRNAAMLNLNEQIECCDAVINIWIEAGNLDAAESCGRISIALKIKKFEYNSIEVAEACVILSEIHMLQGNHHSAFLRANQSESILEIMDAVKVDKQGENMDVPHSLRKEHSTGKPRTLRDFYAQVSIFDSLQESPWEEASNSAQTAINMLFAA
jgi:hypothetical protein